MLPETGTPDGVAQPTSLDDRTPIGAIDADDEQFLPVTQLRRDYLDYVSTKQLEIEEQKVSRHYYHGAQWDARDLEILRARRQPIITFNRVARTINRIIGLVERLRQDPKAYPRTPRQEEGAEVATSTVRYVCDRNDWRTVSKECAKQAAIEGIGGVELKLVAGDTGDPDIAVCDVNGEDFFYDPRSFRPDFSDGRYHGLAKWIDVDLACELFPEQAQTILNELDEAGGSDLTTHADREIKWWQVNRRRCRLVEQWYKKRGKWCWAFYISATLLDEGISPFLDDRGETMSRFIMFSTAVDHDGDRYGFVRNLKGPQDEINQRRSKLLHISNARRLIMDKGAVDDVETARREWSRPDGVIERNPGKAIQPDETAADLEAQSLLYQDAKAEIDGTANVLQATMGDMPKNVSGRAINLLQQGGTAELGDFLMNYRAWKIRVYRAMFSAAQRFWTAERWIRVTDDEGLAQFIQVNGLGADQFGRPAIVNALGSLDVDIILDEGPDVVNMMSDALDVLSQMPPGAVPPQLLLELMPIPGRLKQKLLAMLQPPVDPMQAIATRLKLEGLAAENETERATAEEKRAKAVMDSARATHLNVESGLNAQQTFALGLRSATTPPPAPPVTPPPQPQGPIPQGSLPHAAPPAPPGGLPAPMQAALLAHARAMQGAPRPGLPPPQGPMPPPGAPPMPPGA